jgi:hypothetical protein
VSILVMNENNVHFLYSNSVNCFGLYLMNIFKETLIFTCFGSTNTNSKSNVYIAEINSQFNRIETPRMSRKLKHCKVNE